MKYVLMELKIDIEPCCEVNSEVKYISNNIDSIREKLSDRIKEFENDKGYYDSFDKSENYCSLSDECGNKIEYYIQTLDEKQILIK
ncbi:MAG: hypothetical protein E6182_18875 [Clostridioides difficile]|nr:hypothetical protein [Clostridioides difficile]